VTLAPETGAKPVPVPHPVIVFDTDCVLCSGMVAFVLRFERDAALHFAGAWSPEGARLAAAHGFAPKDLDATFLVVVGGKGLTRSDAAIEISRHLKAPWRWLGVLRIVPRSWRDCAYDLIARRRYRWFGRRENCTLVPPDQRHRFTGVGGARARVS